MAAFTTDAFSSAGSLLRKGAVCFFYALLLIGLVDRGAVDPRSASMLAAGIFLLLALSAPVAGLPRHSRSAMLTAWLLLVGTALMVAIQTLPLSPAITPHPAFEVAGAFLSGTPRPTASITPADDWLALTTNVALPFGFFIAGLILFDSDERAMAAFRAMAVGGGIIAIVSIGQYLLFPDRLGFAEKRYFRESVTGFFVNRNTAATFFGLVSVALFTLFWRDADRVKDRLMTLVFGRASAYRDSDGLRRALIFGGLMLASLAALMLTHSRAGVLSGFIAIALAAFIMTLTGPRARKPGMALPQQIRWSRRIAGASGGFLAILLLFYVFSGRAQLRAEIGGTDDARFCILPGILAAARDNLPWGTGLASFADAYAPYHDPACGIAGVFYRAHNVYAEGLLTLGIAFPLLALSFIGALTAIFLHGLRNRKSYRFAAVAGLAGLLLVALHSALDFSLQIPGFAMSFAAFLAPLVTLCLRPPGGGKRRRSIRRASAAADPQAGPAAAAIIQSP